MDEVLEYPMDFDGSSVGPLGNMFVIVRKRLTEAQIMELQAKVAAPSPSGQQKPKIIFLNADQPHVDDIPKFYLDERLDY